MIIAKVVGTVVSTKKDIDIAGAKFLLVEKCDQQGKRKGDFHVVLDLVGAGYDEMVLIAQSTPARETPMTKNKPIDAVLTAIVDRIDENENVVYQK